MKIIALRSVKHNHVKYSAGEEIPAESFGKRLDSLKQEFSELELLKQAGAVSVVEERVEPVQPLDSPFGAPPDLEKPKRAKKAKD